MPTVITPTLIFISLSKSLSYLLKISVKNTYSNYPHTHFISRSKSLSDLQKISVKNNYSNHSHTHFHLTFQMKPLSDLQKISGKNTYSNHPHTHCRFLRHILHRFNGAGGVIYVVKWNEHKGWKMGCFFTFSYWVLLVYSENSPALLLIFTIRKRIRGAIKVLYLKINQRRTECAIIFIT